MTKKRNIIVGIIKWINSIFGILLLFAYTIPYLEPKNIGILAIMSIFTPVLILINIAFVIYWLIQLKKEIFISLVMLLLGFNAIQKLYAYNDKGEDGNFSIMSYNVRGFNIYKWTNDENIAGKISNFIKEKSPDVVCFQEFYNDKNLNFKQYPYHYIKGSSKTEKFGQAIYSKYKIINSGSLNFEATANNAIFIDILKNNDTIRIYNVHLQSLKVNKLAKNVTENKEKIAKQISNAYKKQQEQVVQLVAHKKTCPYKTIICGDFNNTAFSYSYKQLAANMQDTFTVKGTGFGKTFSAFVFPFRIDFILANNDLKVKSFKTYSTINYSDHKAVEAKLNL